MLAKQRVKLMSMTAEKKWKDKGQGTLTLRRAAGAEGAGKQPYFVFTTDSGGWVGGWECRREANQAGGMAGRVVARWRSHGD